MKGNKGLGKGYVGAHVNIAVVAESKRKARAQMKQIFEENNFKLIRVEGLQPISQRFHGEPNNSLFRGMLKEFRKGVSFSWGDFQAFRREK